MWHSKLLQVAYSLNLYFAAVQRYSTLVLQQYLYSKTFFCRLNEYFQRLLCLFFRCRFIRKFPALLVITFEKVAHRRHPKSDCSKIRLRLEICIFVNILKNPNIRHNAHRKLWKLKTKKIEMTTLQVKTTK